MGLFDNLFGGGKPAQKPAKKKPSGVSAQARELAAKLLAGRGTPVDGVNLGKLLTLLEKSPSGWADVQAVVALGVTVKFDMSDGGALFRPAQNEIVLNRMRIPRSLATSFCHEATHAQLRAHGLGGNMMAQERDEFAEQIVREETETFLREAIVGRELLHWERSHGVAEWHQNLVEHPLQMWFALVYRVTYTKRPSPGVLDSDAAMPPPLLNQWVNTVLPYFRKYVEPYRIVQHIKWDISRGKRPPLDSDTLRGVLSASFEKQKTADRNPYRT